MYRRTIAGGMWLAALAATLMIAPPAAADAAAWQALGEGDYGQAEKAFRAMTGREGTAEAWLGLAHTELETGRYDAAVASAGQVARQATAEQRDFALRALVLSGEAHAARGRLDAAAQAWKRAADSAPAHPAVYRAQVLLGRLLLSLGKRDEATRYLSAVIDAYNADRIQEDPAGLTYVAMAAWALESLHEANDMFRQAAVLEPRRVETQLEWARLFQEKYDTQNAGQGAVLALRENPHLPDAHVLIAELALRDRHDFRTAEKAISHALEVNPQHAQAHALRAALALRELDFAAAEAHVERALRINPKHLVALSTLAAMHFLSGDTAAYEAAKREVLSVSPTYSRMYDIIGEFAEWEHRYDALVDMARESLQVDPTNPTARSMLAMNLLRTGEEEAGLQALHEAWEVDGFNVRVYNLLNFYEQVVDKLYEDFDAGPFRFRMHKDERPVLERYAVPLLSDAYAHFRTHYQFTPAGPLRMEMYAEREHFSVRTTGMPNAGVQGVCFGKVVTALSPAGGPFNWGQIVWHELAHVFHLQMSDSRVPRWFTEGLAEYETLVARPEWQREDDHALWLALEADRLPRIRHLNRAFTHARNVDDVMAAYYLSAMVVKYIVERFGMTKVRRMLRTWGDGQTTEAVLQQVLGLSSEALDKDFRDHTRGRLERYHQDFFVDFERYGDLRARADAARAQPDDPDAQAALAAAYWRAERLDDSEAAALQVLVTHPKHAVANYVMARIAVSRGDPARAEGYLREVLAGGKESYVIRLLLGHSVLARGELDASRRQFEAATRADPLRIDAWHGLLQVAVRAEDSNLLLRSLRAIVDLDQHDQAASARLLSLLAERKAWDLLVEYGERALWLDPAPAETHRLLAEGYLHTQAPRKALEELDVALIAGHHAPGVIHLLRARAFADLGKPKAAQAAAKAAVDADAALAPLAKALLQPGPG